MTIEELFKWIATEYGWISLIMVAIISALTELVKIPIKMLTSKIKNDKLRKLANKSIILMTFAIAFLIEYLGSVVAPQLTTFNSTMALIEGSLANLIYAIGEGLISSSKVKATAETIKSVSSDGTMDSSDLAKVVQTATDSNTDVVKKANSDFTDIISRK